MEGSQADIAVIGLAVMGQNLVLNMNDHGFRVVAFNRTVSKVDEFLESAAKGTNVIGAHSVEDMVKLLKKPRRVMIMVKAGEAVDETIEHLLPYLEAGDIIIDGGNSLFTDTIRRLNYVTAKGLLYIGAGVSGGEEGARHGPSIMPGGSKEAWEQVKPIFQAIAAKGNDGLPCCDWVGEGGAGHYVKMVHNGIEYSDMQLIAETYHLLKDLVGLNNDEMSQIFKDWNQGVLDSYLIQITSEILSYKDQANQHLIDKILDSAGQKGTGKWTVNSAAELGQPASVIAEALFARFTSSLQPERAKASHVLKGPENKVDINKETIISSLDKALYASKIISYSQGYMLMRAAAQEYSWNLNYGGVAQMWTGGCIIRSRFLSDIKKAYEANPGLSNLLLDPFFTTAITSSQNPWREVVSAAIRAGIPIPGLSSALAFYDSYRSERLPANLVQAQRDYFGAHSYELLDKPGEYFHTDWTGHGGKTASGTYNV